tara:strand:+ start:102 stop:278 length:177 start_codon:yes stop_codon:yes gene_type:complete
MSGNLYQLRSRDKIPLGRYFFVDGPYDKHGYVLKQLDTTKEGTLYLIRGTGGTIERDK